MPITFLFGKTLHFFLLSVYRLIRKTKFFLWAWIADQPIAWINKYLASRSGKVFRSTVCLFTLQFVQTQKLFWSLPQNLDQGQVSEAARPTFEDLPLGSDNNASVWSNWPPPPLPPCLGLRSVDAKRRVASRFKRCHLQMGIVEPCVKRSCTQNLRHSVDRSMRIFVSPLTLLLIGISTATVSICALCCYCKSTKQADPRSSVFLIKSTTWGPANGQECFSTQ